MTRGVFHSVFVVLLAAILLGFLPSGQFLLAQRTASLIGRVTDQSGAITPGVTITAASVATGIERTALTDDRGNYALQSLEPGLYRVTAELPGFQSVVHERVELSVGSTVTLNFALQIAGLAEQTTVTAEAVLIDRTTSAVGGLVTAEQVSSLPLNGRNFTQLALLQPGVILDTKSKQSVSGLGRGPKISISGARPTGSTFVLDGIIVNNKDNTGAFGFTGNTMGTDAIREFQVQSNTFSSEFGRATGGVVNIVTKSGTNEFHGSAFEYHRNDNLDARNFFDVIKPEFKRNQFGGSVGGPIFKNQTFFFVAYEGLREGLGVTIRTAVPDANARRGILPNVPAFTVAPKVVPYLEKIFPLPNAGRSFGNGTGEYAFSGTNTTREDYLSTRIDHKLTDKDSVFGRYTLDDSNRTAPDTLPGFFQTEDSRPQFLTLEYNRILSPRLLNTVRAGVNRHFTNQDLVVPQGLSMVPGRPMGSVRAAEVGHPGKDTTPRVYGYNHFQYEDHLGLEKGRHHLRLGVQVHRYQQNGLNVSRYGGRFDFASLEDYLKARPQVLEATAFGVDFYRGVRQWVVGSYIQDALEVTPSFTLNLGLRYEPFSVPTEIQGKVANVINPLDPAVTLGAAWENPSKKNFAPRLGIAWDPFGTAASVVRGGFGIYDAPILLDETLTQYERMPPFFLQARLQGGNIPFPDVPPEILIAPKIVDTSSYEPNPARAYVMQWNLSLEQRVGTDLAFTAGYMASRGVHLVVNIDRNTPIPTIVNGQKVFRANNPRRNPNFLEMGTRSNSGDSYYHALVMSVRRQSGAGLHWQGSYTFSKAIDTASMTRAQSFHSDATGLYDSEDTRRDRGLASFHVSHNFSGNFSYDLPRWSDQAALVRYTLGGWSVRGILSLATGAPFTVGYNFDRNFDLSTAERPDLVSGKSNNPINPGNPDQYFDASSFTLQPPGFFGNLARNTLFSPGLAGFDFSLGKNFSLRQDSRLEFRAEFFNILNRANFETPGASTTSTGYLRIFNNRGAFIPQSARVVGTTGSSRQIQFGLRFVF